jgi:hypothetical protein
MRQGIFSLLAVLLTPLAAQAGDAFSVPSSGVLASPKPVASLYDSDAIATGKPVGAKKPVDIRPSASVSPEPKLAAAKPVKRSASVTVTRSSLDPYVRRSQRPAATLPPGTIAPAPYRPGMAMPAVEPLEPAPVTSSYMTQPAAPRAPAPQTGGRGFFGSSGPAALTANTAPSPARASDPRFVNRGFFTGSIPTAQQPAPMPQSVPSMSQGQPIY